MLRLAWEEQLESFRRYRFELECLIKEKGYVRIPQPNGDEHLYDSELLPLYRAELARVKAEIAGMTGGE
jgi:hypothetical protein